MQELLNTVILGFYRFLLGMGEAGNWPAGVKVVEAWFPVDERALASGIFNNGSSLGAVAAPPIIVWIVVRAGWRAAFLAVGGVGLVWVVTWLTVCHPPPDSVSEERAVAISLWRLFRTRFVWGLTLAKFFLDPVGYFYITPINRPSADLAAHPSLRWGLSGLSSGRFAPGGNSTKS